ncbi:hypothetical protein HUO13_00650 [Saccharopolyspora erythraea]|uniref:DUF6346 domain-containing protein n=1 Tax=Saccharopolyspora erythraea TaxID=1836 RepID=UPI001BA4A832|nr:DUF6346 domain-containing protein [Saccharopolyspora erythraea]QUG99508.1 hypothetical protein HUO13_00650 [Saccharopolyspora erythraea]
MRRDEPTTTPSDRAWRVGYIVSQVLVRFLVLAVFHTVMGATGIMTTDGTPTERGTALANRCELAGPVSMSGLGWWWDCDATITWADGDAEERSFKFSDLTPRNYTTPAPVVRRELDNRGSNVVVDEPAPHSALGWALFIPLLGLALVGFRIPGIPPLRPAEHRERRRRSRLQTWPPAVLAAGWWLVIAGGLGHGHLDALTWVPVAVIIAGHAFLAVGAALAVSRRRGGYPDRQPPIALGGRQFRANLLLVVGALGVAAGLLSGQPPTGLAALTALPLVAVAFGVRGRLVAGRIQQLQHTT